jgi:hypothetical protein
MANNPNEKLNGLINQALNALAKAEEYAKEHGMSFTFSPVYGMGGTFRPIGKYDDRWEYDGDGIEGDHAWFPSSKSC